ncbi:uncharacterized protein CC84DRAFT_175961 [Paraphaeosphaeria sporulosa]|uniref:Secreted protein n=1 Tax=Paraphaeosphaeria sporulosa TaxID=1460663 RepID=A0A177D1V9_9PLEO|nr:uncharacterized protein CC84DRAFT_175961 [Paraphaeosphaeria sporulosa]OAG13029.1 hypothetical protein CC84DRAFT_175961 [Paraphaeosphaeria sporulosa]
MLSASLLLSCVILLVRFRASIVYIQEDCTPMLSARRYALPTALAQRIPDQRTNMAKSDRFCKIDWLTQATHLPTGLACIMQSRVHWSEVRSLSTVGCTEYAQGRRINVDPPQATRSADPSFDGLDVASARRESSTFLHHSSGSSYRLCRVRISAPTPTSWTWWLIVGPVV